MRLALTILFVGVTVSRASADGEFELGVKGGLSSATLSHENRENRLGPSAGLAADLQWSLSERATIAGQIEVLYMPRGANVVVDGTPIGNLKQHYLDLVVLARPAWRVGPFSIYVMLGGGLNVLAHATNEDSNGKSRDVTSEVRRLDVSVVLGAGVAVPLPRTLTPLQLSAIFLEVRRDQGLIDVDPTDGGYKNRTNSIMLGLSFAVSPRTSPTSPTQSARLSQ